MKRQWEWQGKILEVELVPRGGGHTLRWSGGELVIEAVKGEEPGELRLCAGAGWEQFWVHRTSEGVWVSWRGRTWWLRPVKRPGARPAGPTATANGLLRAPVPAQVREIRVQEGERVQQGQVLVVLEAMKMEFRLQAPFAGVVQRVRVQHGQVVERDAVVVEIQPE